MTSGPRSPKIFKLVNIAQVFCEVHRAGGTPRGIDILARGRPVLIQLLEYRRGEAVPSREPVAIDNWRTTR